MEESTYVCSEHFVFSPTDFKSPFSCSETSAGPAGEFFGGLFWFRCVVAAGSDHGILLGHCPGDGLGQQPVDSLLPVPLPS